jgi:hypothetical protein
MCESYTKNRRYAIIDVMEVFMTLFNRTNFIIFFSLTFIFGAHDSILYFIYYKVGSFLCSYMNKDWANKLGFLSFCTLSLMAIVYLIRQG